jgi:hypothetical protein
VWEFAGGNLRTEFAGSTKNPKKSSKHQIYQSERIFFQKNYVYFLKSVKKPKIRIGATQRSLQLNPKSKKNDRNTKSTNQNKKNLK